MNISKTMTLQLTANHMKIFFKYAKENDFIYLDPPYYPLNKKSFIHYIYLMNSFIINYLKYLKY